MVNFCRIDFALAYIDNQAKRMGMGVLHASRLSCFCKRSRDSFKVKCTKKYSFLVIDMFLFLHNLLANKVLFTNDYHAEGRKGKTSL